MLSVMAGRLWKHDCLPAHYALSDGRTLSLKKADLTISGVIFLASIYLYYIADCIPTSDQFKDVGAGIWPKIIFTCLMLACIVLFVTTLRKESGAKALSGKEELLRLLMPVSLCIAYVAAMKWVGFLVGSMIFSIAYMCLIGYRKKAMIALISLAVPFLVGLIFLKLMYIPIPKGVGIFKTISEFFLTF